MNREDGRKHHPEINVCLHVLGQQQQQWQHFIDICMATTRLSRSSPPITAMMIMRLNAVVRRLPMCRSGWSVSILEI